MFRLKLVGLVRTGTPVAAFHLVRISSVGQGSDPFGPTSSVSVALQISLHIGKLINVQQIKSDEVSVAENQ